MGEKKPRVIGTTEAAIATAESELGFRLPPSFRSWLLVNNGLSPERVNIFSVFDERDPRKTWDSIASNYHCNWAEWLENFAGEEISSENLLPIGEYGNGDFCCLDYNRRGEDGEVPVVLWSHETGEIENRAEDFADFLRRLERGEYESD